MSGSIHAIDGMFIRSGEVGMTYSRTINNVKHGNQVSRVKPSMVTRTEKRLTMKGAGLSAEVGELDRVEDNTTVAVLDRVQGSTIVAVLD
jgi:hypothetical protein